MTPIYSDGEISIRPPDPTALYNMAATADVKASIETWLTPALTGQRDVVYFSIYHAHAPIGQIFLHDINARTGEALVGYELFQPHQRGRGVGTRALRLLQQYVVEQTACTRLIIITGVDNAASRRIAEKCGFVYVGVAREGWPQIVYEWELYEWECDRRRSAANTDAACAEGDVRRE